MDNIKLIDDKKYMWDGEEYSTERSAREIKLKYEQDQFETKIFEKDGKYLVYTRRVVTDIVVEGEPV